MFANSATALVLVPQAATKKKGPNLERTLTLFSLFCGAGPLAIRAAKLAIDKGEQMDPETALDFERQCYETILGTQDRLEGLKAFAEKREPVYRGE